MISADGRYVVFTSEANNLVPGDTNGCSDVFRYDRVLHSMERVSVAFDGAEANGDSYYCFISANGQVVGFNSYASNLVPDDTNGIEDVFVRDYTTGQIARVSVASDGTQARPVLWRGINWRGNISADGRYVVFDHSGEGLVPDDHNLRFDVFVHDRLTRQTERVSINSDGTEAVKGSSWAPSITADGRYVAFHTEAPDLVPDTRQSTGLIVHDRATRESICPVRAYDGSFANGPMGGMISSDGHYLGITTEATNLVQGDEEGPHGIFLLDRLTGEVQRITKRWVGSGPAYDLCQMLLTSMSPDARFLTIQSDSTNLVPNDSNRAVDVFLYDRESGAFYRVSQRSDGVEGDRASFGGSVSADGEAVVFESYAGNLVPGDTHGYLHIYLKEMVLDSSEPVIVIDTPQPHDVLPVGTPLQYTAMDSESGIMALSGWVYDGTYTTTVSSGCMLAPGAYLLTVEAVNGAGLRATESREFVIYDPQGGFATGSGWVTSPAGAFLGDIGLSGKASFTLVVSYHEGAVVPIGHMLFHFGAANLRFHGEGYDWLVISGPRAQCRGYGSLNGVPGYRFLVAMEDGDFGEGSGLDRFRIRVWDSATEVPVYDNVVLAPLGGGSVVLHK
jgi:Tol biopolymer transport system component